MEYWGSPPSGVPSKPFGRSYSPMHRFVSAISGTNNYTYFRGGGEVFHFIKQGDGSYKVDVPGVWGFTKNGNNTFTLTLDGGDKEEYDTAGKLTGIVDSDGNTWSFSYGTVGSYSNALTKVTEPDSDTFEFTYDSSTARVTKVYANGPGTTWELYYDGSDNMTKLTVVDCQSCGSCGTRTFTYSSGSGDPLLNNNLTSVKNADAVEKQAFSYSSADQATKATVGLESDNFNYDNGAGRRTQTDPVGHKTVYGNDGKGRVTKLERLASGGSSLGSSTFQYDDTGDNITKTTLPDGLEIVGEYDADGHLTKETRQKGALSVSRTWQYDSTVDRVTKYTDPRGYAWVYQYDAEGNVTKFTAPEVTLGVPAARQAISTYSYDADGNLTKTVDPLGVEHHFFYSDKDLLTKQIDDAAAGGLAVTQTWQYDAQRRLTKATNALSQATTYEYTGFQVTKVTSPGGTVNTFAYDVDCRLTQSVQGSGTSAAMTTAYVYDNSNRVTKQTLDPSGLALATEFYFDANGRFTRQKNPDGNFGPQIQYDGLNRRTKTIWGELNTTFTFDAAGRLTNRGEVVGQGAPAATYTWAFDGLGQLTKATGPLSHYQTFDYDAGSNVTRQYGYQSGGTLLADAKHYFDEVGTRYKRDNMLADATAATTEMVHDVAGRLTKQEDPLDNASTFAYDALGRMTRATDPASQNTDTLYDALGRATKVTDPLTNFTQTFYDADGQVTKRIDELSAAVVYAYDPLGRVTRVTDPLSANSDSLYDKVGRLTKSSDPAGGEVTYLYDAASRQTKVTVKVTASVDRATSFAYDSQGRLTRTTDPLTFTTDQVYDPWSRVTKRTDAENKSTTFEFDAGSQLTKVIYPASGQGSGPNVVTEYDGLGRRTKVLNDSSVAVLRFYYDRLGRQTKLEYANGDAETYDYDIASRRTKLTRPTTDVISYLYNSRGLLTKTTLPGSVDQTYSYDAAGRRTKADDTSTDLTWYIDAAGRVTKLIDGKLTKTIINAYDAAGRRTSLDGPEASDTQAWSFDAVGRVTKITENASDRAAWLYNLAGQQTKLTYGSGSYGTWDYDGGGRLTNLVHKKSGGTVIQSFAYVLDKAGNRTKLTLDGGDWLQFQYDGTYQLTKETRKTSGGSVQYANSFIYDRLGDRTKLEYDDGSSVTTTTYLYSNADQLTKETIGGTDTTYSYSANGNLTRKATGANNYDYLYDARNLITKYDAPGTSSDTTYLWDTEDRRVKKDLNGTVTRMLYEDGLGEILAEYDGAATPALQASYIPIGLDSNVSMTRSGTLHYFHGDAIDSTWNISRASDEVLQNTYQYQAFGSLHGSATENVTNTRRFTGAEWNSEDSSQTHGVRHYFSPLGRWNRRDALLDIDGPNIYVYVRANPVSKIDPWGAAFGCSRPPTCCCCANSVQLRRLFAVQIPPQAGNAPQFGHYFDVIVGVSYIKGSGDDDCILHWLEKSNAPGVRGAKPGEWADPNTFPDAKDSPTLAPWYQRTKPCPGSESVRLWDSPMAEVSPRYRRYLQIRIVVESGKDCTACPKWGAALVLCEILKTDAQGNISTQSLTEGWCPEARPVEVDFGIFSAGNNVAPGSGGIPAPVPGISPRPTPTEPPGSEF